MGDLLEQLFYLKVSALQNEDIPIIWKLPEETICSIVTMSRERFVRRDRLYNLPVDITSGMGLLICDYGVVYPFLPPTHDFKNTKD